MQLRISTRGCVRPSVRPLVRPSVRPSVPCYFQMTKILVFEGGKSSIAINNNSTMINSEEVAYDVPPQYLFHSFFSTASSAPYCVRVYNRVSLPQDELVTGCLVFPALVTQDYNYRRIGPSCSAGLCKYTFPLVGRCVRASL